MENNNVTIENLSDEYNKYIISKLIGKEYNFHNIREIVKELSEKTDFVEYSDKKSNQEIARTIQDLIQKSIYGKIYKI